jgi:polar amino acid transport system substrate-binding protein
MTSVTNPHRKTCAPCFCYQPEFYMGKLYSVFCVILLLSSCTSFPKDANNTLESVRGHVIRVGLSAYDSSEAASGRPATFEMYIINQFAREVNAKVQWVKGSQSEMIQLLEDQHLHLAIGGYKSPSPFEKVVSFSRPYLVAKIIVGAVGSAPLPETIKNKEVVVLNPVIGLYVKENGGKPVLKDTLTQGSYLIAGTEEELKKMHVQVSNIVLHEEKLIIALPKGENALLMQLEKCIDKYGRFN